MNSKAKHVCHGLLVLANCAMVGCAHMPMPSSRLHVQVGRPFIITESDKNYGWGYFSHPRMVKLEDGTLIVMYYLGGDGGTYFRGEKPLENAGPAISRDGGVTWSIGKTHLGEAEHLLKGGVAHIGGARQCYFPGGFRQDRTTEMWSLQSLDAVQKQGESVLHFTSADSAREVLQINKGDVDSDGRMFFSFTGKTRGAKRFHIAMMRSDDGGNTFKVVSRVADTDDVPESLEGPTESDVLVLDNDEVLVVMRGGLTRLWGFDVLKDVAPLLLARSTDHGESWDVHKMSQVGCMPKIRKMDNGILVLAFGRPGNNLVFSLDQGQTWIRETPVPLPKQYRIGQTSGYVDFAEVAPGRLLVVFDTFGRSNKKFFLWDPPTPVNTVWGVFVDVERPFL